MDEGVRILELARNAQALFERQPARKNAGCSISCFRTAHGRTVRCSLPSANPLNCSETTAIAARQEAVDGGNSAIELARQQGLGRIEVANWPMAAITRWYTGDSAGALDDALAAIAAAAKVGHQRAEVIGHHAAYFCRREMLEVDAASNHLDDALTLTQRLGARRFEAEALAFRGELQRTAGRRAEALRDVGEALTISRETGMAFIGPMILGILTLAADDPQVRSDALAEGEALLAAGSASHNHLQFRRDAIDACLDVADWDGAERHSAALETYTRQEPLPWSRFFVARGRALAAYGRGRRDAALMAELASLREEGARLNFKLSLPAIEAALAEPDGLLIAIGRGEPAPWRRGSRVGKRGRSPTLRSRRA